VCECVCVCTCVRVCVCVCVPCICFLSLISPRSRPPSLHPSLTTRVRRLISARSQSGQSCPPQKRNLCSEKEKQQREKSQPRTRIRAGGKGGGRTIAQAEQRAFSSPTTEREGERGRGRERERERERRRIGKEKHKRWTATAVFSPQPFFPFPFSIRRNFTVHRYAAVKQALNTSACRCLYSAGRRSKRGRDWEGGLPSLTSLRQRQPSLSLSLSLSLFFPLSFSLSCLDCSASRRCPLSRSFALHLPPSRSVSPSISFPRLCELRGCPGTFSRRSLGASGPRRRPLRNGGAEGVHGAAARAAVEERAAEEAPAVVAAGGDCRAPLSLPHPRLGPHPPAR